MAKTVVASTARATTKAARAAASGATMATVATATMVATATAVDSIWTAIKDKLPAGSLLGQLALCMLDNISLCGCPIPIPPVIAVEVALSVLH